MVEGSLFSSCAMCLKTSFLVTMPNSRLCVGGGCECVRGWGRDDLPLVWDEHLSNAKFPHHLNNRLHRSLVGDLKRGLQKTKIIIVITHTTHYTTPTYTPPTTLRPLTGSMSPLKLTLGTCKASSCLFILRAESMKYTRLSSLIPSSLIATWSVGGTSTLH